MDTTTLSIAMRIKLHRIKHQDNYEAENDDQEQDDIAQYEEELNAELDREAARELDN